MLTQMRTYQKLEPKDVRTINKRTQDGKDQFSAESDALIFVQKVDGKLWYILVRSQT